MAITDILGGALSVGRSLIQPTKAVDVVAITGGGFAPLFSQARPLTASVYEMARIMEHPLETGAIIADHIVFDPIEIELPVIIVGEGVYRNTYALIRAAYRAGTLLTVVTRTGSYPNMVIYEMPHDERPESFDAVEMLLRLREARFVSPRNGALTQAQVADPKQSSTIQRGAQQTSAAGVANANRAGVSYAQSGAGTTPTPQGSTLYQWYAGSNQ